jgi:mono/diheme cytochrome c family protein
MGRYVFVLVVGLAVGVIVSVLVGVLIVGPLAIAHRSDLPLERVYGDFAVSLASRLHSGGTPSPSTQGQRAVQAGRLAYIGSCAECHGASGDGKGVFGTAIYPPATDLTTGDTKEKTDAQLYWIIKNGLSFTGMPAFGSQYSDQDIWSMVSYLRSLQQQQSAAVVVATPNAEQLAEADPHGNAVQRGAAVYFAQGCQSCHGAIGNAPGELGLGGGRQTAEAVRRGRPGMPVYDAGQITDAQLADLATYMDTFAGQQQGLQPGQFQSVPSTNRTNPGSTRSRGG